MENKTKIRNEILFIPMKSWDKIDEIIIDGYYIEVTPQELIDLIGFDGGNFLSAKATEEEKIFIDEYYKLGIEKYGK